MALKICLLTEKYLEIKKKDISVINIDIIRVYFTRSYFVFDIDFGVFCFFFLSSYETMLCSQSF